jgi:hypothetical protein
VKATLSITCATVALAGTGERSAPEHCETWYRHGVVSYSCWLMRILKAQELPSMDSTAESRVAPLQLFVPGSRPTAQ